MRYFIVSISLPGRTIPPGWLYIKVLGNVGDAKSPSLLPVCSCTEAGRQGEGENGPKEMVN